VTGGEQFTMRRRSLPGSLRHLAGKIGSGQMTPEAAALVLEMMAAEILGAPACGHCGRVLVPECPACGRDE